MSDTDKNQQSFISVDAQVGDKVINFEVGRFAGQATSAVVGRLGDSMVLATVVGGKERTDIDWFPLQVEYQEKLYAGGKIKGSRWVKREGRPSDEAILTSRVIDRSIRPLFADGYKGEVQIIVTPLSADEENDLDVLSLCTVSAALAISGLPWEGPIGGTRIALDQDGKYLAFPTYEEKVNSLMDLIVASSSDAICMVEAGAKEVTEDQMIKALEFARDANQQVINAINELVAKVGKPKIEFVRPDELSLDIARQLDKEAKPVIANLLKSENNGKINKDELYTLTETFQESHPEIAKATIKNYLEKSFKQAARDQIIDSKTRLDGRATDEIRPITIDVGMIPRTHGSGMFKRGETQALTLVTLGPPSDSQTIELMDQEIDKRYIHHYNMPPYSVGETGRIGYPSRREIGHGALAERALIPVLPSVEEFPYTMRLVSECVSSNGSTSMASTCGSTLSLMDAGVPIKKPVAGIAMGLMVKNENLGVNGDYVVLTDIQGLEDHIGDMDFKVTGTVDGITAIQMDIKVKGINTQVLTQALDQAKKARLYIIDRILEVIPEPRKQLSPYAPKIQTLKIDPSKIGDVIGAGGKIIKKIIEVTGAEIDIDDDGNVFVTSTDEEAIKKAIDWVDGLTRELVVGEVFEQAEVKTLMNFGAFVEVLPGRDGLVHVSRMSADYVSNPADVVKEGDKVKVRVEAIDDDGKVSLSMLFGDDIAKAAANAGPRRNGNGNGGNRFSSGSSNGGNRFGGGKTYAPRGERQAPKGRYGSRPQPKSDFGRNNH